MQYNEGHWRQKNKKMRLSIREWLYWRYLWFQDCSLCNATSWGWLGFVLLEFKSPYELESGEHQTLLQLSAWKDHLLNIRELHIVTHEVCQFSEDGQAVGECGDKAVVVHSDVGTHTLFSHALSKRWYHVFQDVKKGCRPRNPNAEVLQMTLHACTVTWWIVVSTIVDGSIECHAH